MRNKIMKFFDKPIYSIQIGSGFAALFEVEKFGFTTWFNLWFIWFVLSTIYNVIVEMSKK